MFSLRLIEKKDLDFIRQVRSHPETKKYLGTFVLLNEDKQLDWYEKVIKDETQLYFILEKTTVEKGDFNKDCNFIERLGYIRMTNIDYKNNSVCVGGDIDMDERGKGYGKEMYKLIFDLVFDQMNMNCVYLYVLGTNERAMNLYKKMGFKESGRLRQAVWKNGKYLDYIYMDILKEEWKNNKNLVSL